MLWKTLFFCFIVDKKSWKRLISYFPLLISGLIILKVSFFYDQLLAQIFFKKSIFVFAIVRSLRNTELQLQSSTSSNISQESVIVLKIPRSYCNAELQLSVYSNTFWRKYKNDHIRTSSFTRTEPLQWQETGLSILKCKLLTALWVFADLWIHYTGWAMQCIFRFWDRRKSRHRGTDKINILYFVN